MDKHQLVIIPIENELTNPTKRRKVRIVDSATLRHDIGDPNVSFADINHQELEFRSDFRPASRYLYCHYLVAFL